MNQKKDSGFMSGVESASFVFDAYKNVKSFPTYQSPMEFVSSINALQQAAVHRFNRPSSKIGKFLVMNFIKYFFRGIQ